MARLTRSKGGLTEFGAAIVGGPPWAAGRGARPAQVPTATIITGATGWERNRLTSARSARSFRTTRGRSPRGIVVVLAAATPRPLPKAVAIPVRLHYTGDLFLFHPPKRAWV